VLEEVADAAGPVAEQRREVAAGHVLRQHQNAGRRAGPADVQRRAEAVVGVVGWHPDVGDDDVRPVGGRRRPQRVGVADRGDDVDVVAGQQEREPLAQEGLVLADHDAHGSLP
jgi:hypothetical protein